MDELGRLLICRACEQLILEAAACADANDADALAVLFAEDATLARPGGVALQGRAAIQHAYAARPPERITRHLVTNVRVQVVSESEARATSYVQVWSGSLADEPRQQGRPAGRPSVGEFSDQFRKFDCGWLITHREATFVLSATP